MTDFIFIISIFFSLVLEGGNLSFFSLRKGSMVPYVALKLFSDDVVALINEP